MDKKFVSYSDFGAVGDGVTNDFFAIKAAHDYANEHRLPVRAEEGKTYLVTETETDGVADTVSIKTDTDWCGSTILIDDTDVAWVEGNRKRHNYNVFFVQSYYEAYKVEEKYIEKINEAGGISYKSTKRLELGLGFPAMLVLTNSTTRHFIRFGGNENSGVSQRELVVVDADGNIDENTPFLFDFNHVSGITAYRIDIPTLTLENGTILSRASRVNINPEYHSISRGISVTRPNTHIRNIAHKIEGELGKYEPVYEDERGLSYSATQDGYTYRDGKIYDKNGIEYTGDKVKAFIGHSYGGFINMHNTHNVLIEDVTFQARVYYLQGTYDLSAGMSNMMVFKNCRQFNFFGGHDPEHPLALSLGRCWGVAGTNYCKNMIYDGCQLTRYDAHSGVYNGKILNSELGSIRLTGGGDMQIENTTVYYSWEGSPIQLREDYGVTWRGHISMKNCHLRDIRGEGRISCILMAYSANHNFGYRTNFPNITIDNLKIDGAKPEMPLLYEFEMKPNWAGYFYRSVRDPNIAIEGAICADGKPNVNPYTPPEFITVKNNEANGYEVTLPDVPFFRDTKIEGIKTVD